jgi:EmrB/QacA subfamily drug resistance transporter
LRGRRGVWYDVLVMEDPATAAPGERLSRGTLLALVAMGLGVFLIANDFTALAVALPVIEKEFDTDVDTVQWVINGYALVFGCLIITGGRLADMFGRRRLFFVGAGIFAVFSALSGAAPTIGTLLGARALMGVGGAIMWPAILGMTFAALPAKKAGLAGGLILGVAGIGNAFGPLLGGLLTDALSWRWVFFLNLPVCAFAILVTWRFIHQPAVEDAGDRVDYAGVVTLTVALVVLLLALDIATDKGLGDPLIWAMIAASVVLLLIFAWLERRAGANALVPGDVMGNWDFTWACLAVVCLAVTFFAALLYVPQYFQKLLEYSPLEAGAALLPFMGCFALVSFIAGSLYERLGAKPIMSVGASLMCAGTFALSLIQVESGYLAAVPGMVMLGIGSGLFIPTVTTAAVTVLDPSRASLAGAILYMFQVAGGSVGLGLTTTIFATASHDKLASDVQALGTAVSRSEVEDVQGILAGTDSAQQVLARFPGRADTVTELVGDAFVHGVQWAFRVDAAIALIGVAITILFVGGRLRLGRRATVAPAQEPSA